ncbi:hypothetical protein R3P38DRAFT_3347703 [Favolaschia claudopus]|uniref:Uncharacterized protein n=1 Tax=Favolaschia claudopus TaxID=2862362 RepID=A0AAW0CUE9_9AGAR
MLVPHRTIHPTHEREGLSAEHSSPPDWFSMDPAVTAERHTSHTSHAFSAFFDPKISCEREGIGMKDLEKCRGIGWADFILISLRLSIAPFKCVSSRPPGNLVATAGGTISRFECSIAQIHHGVTNALVCGASHMCLSGRALFEVLSVLMFCNSSELPIRNTRAPALFVTIRVQLAAQRSLVKALASISPVEERRELASAPTASASLGKLRPIGARSLRLTTPPLELFRSTPFRPLESENLKGTSSAHSSSFAPSIENESRGRKAKKFSGAD